MTKMLKSIKAAAALCLLIICGVIGSGGVARPAEQCGPFGDPPAQVTGKLKADCEGGDTLGPWKDRDGTDRWACVYPPASAKSTAKLPMLVYLHPSYFAPELTIKRTNLLELRETFPLGGDSKTPGFILLAPLGRDTTHYYAYPNNRGVGWDNWYRQLNPAGDVKLGSTVYHENVDAAAIDHFIAAEVATGKVDTRRIYISGWSNGAAMGYLYALNRPNVAALAVYSSPNPFGAFVDPCDQKPIAGKPADGTEIQIFNPQVPTMQVHNSCDIAGMCPNSEQLTTQLRKAGVTVEDVIIDSYGHRVDQCYAWCGVNPNGDTNALTNPLGFSVGTYNHNQWPSAWTSDMFDFLRSHPADAAR